VEDKLLKVISAVAEYLDSLQSSKCYRKLRWVYLMLNDILLIEDDKRVRELLKEVVRELDEELKAQA
jgi:hypothetical protein